ncbi:MAG: DUF1569 domain-containing protein [Bacteroidetes bacterium]|jgi:hypothetical protein|nr:DUF1569 domain-containing protein [Bacteroidota bacterium]
MPSLFEPQSTHEIIARINLLSTTSQRLWGKMNVAQMLKHCNDALGTATGDIVIKPSFIFKIIGPLIKKKVMENKPYKPGLPTAKEFIVTDEREFEKERQNVLTRINKFIANGEAKVDGQRHPAFGKLTAYEWGFSQWKHFDHHLKQFGV